MLSRNGLSCNVGILIVNCLQLSVYLNTFTALQVNDVGACLKTKENGTTYVTCCQSFFHDQANDRCTECPAGTFGENCKEICAPNFYGVSCIFACNCIFGERCDKVSGCISIQPQECQSGKYLANCSDECQSNFQDIRCQSNCNCTSKDSCEKVQACFSKEKISDMVNILTIGIGSGVLVLSLIIVTKCLKLKMAKKVDRRSIHSILYDTAEGSSEYIVMDNNERHQYYSCTSNANINMVPHAECSLYDVIDDTAIHTNNLNFKIQIPVNEYQNTSTLSEMSHQSLSKERQGHQHVYDTPDNDVNDIHQRDRLNDIQRPNQVQPPNGNGAYSLQRSHRGLYSFKFL